ncbi:acyl carrier protein [Streptomyces sp. SBT349]|uniref:acyl carrier protein n=1 Tax=Streptomyces sp. SBT349 TaxID=1580539 RepID=UPI003B641BC3
MPADRPLGELGIDSLTAAQLSAEVEDRTGVVIPLERFLGEGTLDELVRDLAREAATGGAGEARA